MQFLLSQRGALFCVGIALGALATGTQANVWVLEPSISLDQRADDNFFLLAPTEIPTSLFATRVVGDLAFSRRSQRFSITGNLRVDGLLTTNTEVGDESLSSNQVFVLEGRWINPRSRINTSFTYTLDTPSRDIVSGISDDSSTPTDTNLVETQSLSNNVARQRFELDFDYEYDISRRLEFNVGAGVSDVEHALPDAQDAIFQRYLDLQANNPELPVLSFDEVTIEDTGVFAPDGELDDFQQFEADIGFRYDLTRISVLTTTVDLSRQESRTEPNPASSIPFDDLIPDPVEQDIRRVPRRDSISTTSSFTLGYERFLTPILQVGIEGGVFINRLDASDTVRVEELEQFNTPERVAELLDGANSQTNGFLVGLNVSYDAGRTRYDASFDVNVQPSSVGTQIETNELRGSLDHTISPRLDFSLAGRAFEPDRLGALAEDRFARRFISLEPKIQWKATRDWTVSAAYRYRRQRARIDPASAESNAVLFAITYTVPSEIRDLANASGL